MLKAEIKEKLEEQAKIKLLSVKPLSGGCISEAFIITSESKERYFLKTNSGQPPDMFPKEANGLNELRKAGAIRVPGVFFAEPEFLLTEAIKPGTKENKFFENFGRKFAQLHRYSSLEFGFYENNYIGSSEQQNIPSGNEQNNWTEFYFRRRILFQYRLAEKKNNVTRELTSGISELENKIDEIMAGSEEVPTLLHGDLWSGNFIIDEKGFPCLIDPAVYYGHREADLAMTKLFGGFSPEFYSAYKEVFPLKDGHKYRENIYKLYHVLNHLNLFGGGYYSQAISLIKSYL